MPRGKKTSPEVVYDIMATYAVTNSYKETAKELGMAVTTVKSIVDKNKDKAEFVKLCNEKRSKFSEKAGRIIDKALDRLERTIDNPDVSIPVNHLTTAIGTLYDKKALAEGKPTTALSVTDNADVDKLAELAGYVNKGKGDVNEK